MFLNRHYQKKLPWVSKAEFQIHQKNAYKDCMPWIIHPKLFNMLKKIIEEIILLFSLPMELIPKNVLS